MDMESAAVNTMMNAEMRLILGAAEMVMKLTGSAASRVAAGIYAIMTQQGQTAGKMRLTNFLRESDGHSAVVSIPTERLADWVKACKAYGVRYTNIDMDGTDNVTDFMVMESDMPRIQRIMERFNFVPEITRVELTPAPEIEKEQEKKSDVDDTLSILGDDIEQQEPEWVGSVKVLDDEGEQVTDTTFFSHDELRNYVDEMEKNGESLYVTINGNEIPDYLQNRELQVSTYTAPPKTEEDKDFEEIFVNPEDRKNPLIGLLEGQEEIRLVSGKPLDNSPKQEAKMSDKQEPQHELSMMERLNAAKAKLSEKSASTPDLTPAKTQEHTR